MPNGPATRALELSSRKTSKVHKTRSTQFNAYPLVAVFTRSSAAPCRPFFFAGTGGVPGAHPVVVAQILESNARGHGM
jgi:hypothetical protein